MVAGTKNADVLDIKFGDTVTSFGGGDTINSGDCPAGGNRNGCSGNADGNHGQRRGQRACL